MARPDAEYDDPEGQRTRTFARELFLNRIRRDAPAVLETLREQVLPVYREQWSEGRVGMALHEWGSRWNLTDPWCLDLALETLREWAGWPLALRHLTWARPPRPDRMWAGGDEPRRPTLRLPAWFPALQTFASFEAEAREAFERWVQSYREAGEEWASRHGVEPVPDDRPGHESSPALRFSWLVRFQVLGESASAIASAPDPDDPDAPPVDTGTVGDVVAREAARIGLTLRRAGTGP